MIQPMLRFSVDGGQRFQVRAAALVRHEGHVLLHRALADSFWVESLLANGENWVATECLEPGFVLQLADGREARVHAAGLVRHTQYRNVGIATDDRVGIALVLDLSEERIVPVGDERPFNLARLELGEPCLTSVYNFEVDEFHTYYVGPTAVWVHNTNCTETVASREASIDQAVTRQEAVEKLNQNDTCFAAGTLVHTKDGLKPIEKIAVGDWVLTFPDSQKPPKRARTESEYSFGRVTETFVHADEPVSHVTVFDLAAGIKETLHVTANHPFYVEDEGWVPASELQFGSTLTNSVFGNLLVTKVKHAVERAQVYNIEVEDFHSYYVGQIAVWVHNKGNTPVKSISSLKDQLGVQADFSGLACVGTTS